MIKTKLGRNFIFHSNLCNNPSKIKEFSTYYPDFLSIPSLPSTVASQCLCLNKYIKMDDKTILISSLSAKRIDLMGQLSQNNQQIKRWDERKLELDLIENKIFLITQITHALPSFRNKIPWNYTESITILLSRTAIW